MVFKVKVASATLSGNGSGTASIEVAEGRRFVISKLTISSTGTFNITDIKNSATGESYLSDTAANTNFKDTGGNKYDLPVPLELTGSCKLIFELTDTSGSSNTIRIACHGDES